MVFGNKNWPRVFTCPAGTDKDIARDDLGSIVGNPMFSNREKMVQDVEACNGCDMKDDCDGPVEYVPKEAS